MNVNLAGILEQSARLFGDRTAIVDGPVRLSYREMERRVTAVDAGLRALGVGPGDVVAMLMLNSHRHLELWFAIPRGGAVLNDLNIRLAPAELSFILEDCGATALIVDDAFVPLGLALAESCPTIRAIVHAGDGVAVAGTMSYEALVAENAGTTEPVREVPEDTLAGIFYTGGTTGLPKGAMLSHRNLIENAKHVLIAWGYQSDDVYLHAAPMFHLADGASTYSITACGGRHVIIPAFEPEVAVATIETERVTRALLVPTMLNLIVNHPVTATRDLSSLRQIIYGASPMPEELLRQVMAAIDCAWAQAYGMTEASPLVTYLPAEDHARGSAGEEPHATRLKSAGRAVIGVQVSVRRPDGSETEPGEPGEVWVRGPNIMLGYWKRQDETAAALVEDGWYRSGDAAHMDADGYVYIVDRLKDMIITGGENVYCTEVENALYSHPLVLEAAAFGVPDERWGERVHAAVVLRPGTEACEHDLIEHCRDRIAGYKLPRSVEFHAGALPKSGAGKILKRELRQPHWELLERQVS
jgi:long-chain acyl-CoA synthetase